MASIFMCPKGHASEEEDFCSECGAKIQGQPIVTSADTPVHADAGKVCPDCKAPASGVNFCEICGYNFVSGTGSQVAIPQPPLPPPAPVPVAAATTPGVVKLVITVDAALRTETSPEAPVDTKPIVYAVEKAVNLIGRTSSGRAIFPEVALDFDTAVSHRHGIISQTLEGQLVYRDLGSSNGTRLNGTDVPSLVDTPLKVGDQLTLGHWTRISVEAGA